VSFVRQSAGLCRARRSNPKTRLLLRRVQHLTVHITGSIFETCNPSRVGFGRLAGRWRSFVILIHRFVMASECWFITLVCHKWRRRLLCRPSSVHRRYPINRQSLRVICRHLSFTVAVVIYRLSSLRFFVAELSNCCWNINGQIFSGSEIV